MLEKHLKCKSTASESQINQNSLTHTESKDLAQELLKMRVLYSAHNLIKSIFSAQINKLLHPGWNDLALSTARNNCLPSAVNVLSQSMFCLHHSYCAVFMRTHDSKRIDQHFLFCWTHPCMIVVVLSIGSFILMALSLQCSVMIICLSHQCYLLFSENDSAQ